MTNSTNKPNVVFWIIGIIALLWNAMGVNQYIQQAYNSESYRAMYSEEQLAIIDKLPSWYTAIFAIAVFASLIGCILLLLRKKSAVLLFQIAFIAVVIQTSYNLFINEGKEYYGNFEYSMLIMIPLFAFFLAWYSKNSKIKGWLS
ncbi:hypothetical protein [Urechidicola croceus]|uniref:Sugar transporter n=1 Tax=Urechidicola croceus TaxID=1850246 RepID=A0A1D8P5I6_9FLAO|nr:hypothetical protein [Urechidicola croceus]AOW19829.1 hypothetical protein LPB138_03630 [Urechidicola croceus]